MKGINRMKKSDAIILFNKLKDYYPDATCSLDFSEPFQLVVAVMLSAQCTDERVNQLKILQILVLMN